eukprot:287496-Rhodomonas_salina.1
MAAFAELGVMGEIIRALDDGGWQLPTPIQQEAIPLILGGGDVLGAAETGEYLPPRARCANGIDTACVSGTGKTGAFGIPVLQLMHEKLCSEPEPSASEETSAEGKAASAEAAPKAAPKLQMSMEDKEPLFNVDSSGRKCSALSNAAWGGGRASAGILKGKYCFEVVCLEVAGTVRCFRDPPLHWLCNARR